MPDEARVGAESSQHGAGLINQAPADQANLNEVPVARHRGI